MTFHPEERSSYCYVLPYMFLRDNEDTAFRKSIRKFLVLSFEGQSRGGHQYDVVKFCLPECLLWSGEIRMSHRYGSMLSASFSVNSMMRYFLPCRLSTRTTSLPSSAKRSRRNHCFRASVIDNSRYT